MSRAVAVVSCFLATALVSIPALGQVAGSSQSKGDVFASVREAVNDAADRSLAAALAQQPWMKVSDKTSENQPNSEITPFARLQVAVERVSRLRPIIEPILRQEGLPTELNAVVLVESGGLAAALSPKGARGVWQLMPDTARRYGLVVSAEQDERLDVGKSTRAAALYLRDLYGQFGKWELAFAAYNAGEKAVERAVKRAGQSDFSAIRRELPEETQNYVPTVIASMNRLQHHALVAPMQVVFASVTPGD